MTLVFSFGYGGLQRAKSSKLNDDDDDCDDDDDDCDDDDDDDDDDAHFVYFGVMDRV